MRKDVKRSLVVWPLAASFVVVGISSVATRSVPGARMLVATAIRLWKSVDDSGTNSLQGGANETPGVRIVAAGSAAGKRTSVAPARQSSSDSWAELSAIESWNDVSMQLRQPAVAGIPAPALDTHSDIFGFSDDNRDESPVFELSTPAETGVSVSIDPPASDVAVIQIHPDVFFEDDYPLSKKLDESPRELQSPSLAERPTQEITLPPVYEKPAASVADFFPDLALVESTADSKKSERFDVETNLIKPSEQMRDVSDPSNELAQPQVPETSRDDEDIDEDQSNSGRLLTQPRSATWPIPFRLVEQLDILERIVRQTRASDESEIDTLTTSHVQPITSDELLRWSANVRDLLTRLHESNRLGEDKVRQILDQLRRAESEALISAETLSSRSRRVAWLQAAYSIQRRLAVWEPIFKINSGEFPATQHVGDDVLPVSDAIGQLQARLNDTGDAQGWSDFLLLENLRDAFRSGSDQERRELAQRFLSRLDWPNLARSHQQFLADKSVTDVAVSIRPWASGAVDYSALLHQIERAESNAIDLVTAEIAQSMQALGHANHPQANALAKNLDTHYRNANVRFSISEELINGLMPNLPTREVPVRTTLLGSRVTGISRVSSDLQMRINPSPSSWELTLETIGNVATRSVGRNGPAAINTSSMNPYSAVTRISIQPTDIQLGNASVNVGGRSRLHGINTTYDSWPLLGSLVHSFAENQYFEKASLADRIGRNRIRNQLGQEIDRSVNEKVELASDQFSKTILGPLTTLQLEPKVIDMSSTSSRLIARYRMAGDWQLAAMTPRPRALSDNLFSVQLHQSAINNTLEQLIPQDEALPIDQVLRQCYDLLGAHDRPIPDDLPEDTLIQFAKHRPITIEIENGKVWITMRIIRLQRDNHVRLRNFIVRAAYVPQINGLSAELVRDAYLSISGPGMSMRQRLPVRAIFNKVLSPSRPLPLTSPEMLAERLPEQSGITQFELRDGWIGIAIGKTTENQRVATRPVGIR